MRVPRNAVPYYILTIAYSCLIFYMSSRESVEGPGLDLVPFDKAGHLAEYTILGFLLYLSLHYSFLDHSFLKRFYNTEVVMNATTATLIGSLYGVTDEIHQYYVPGRSADPFDVLADVMGVALGVFLAIELQFLRARMITRGIIKQDRVDEAKHPDDSVDDVIEGCLGAPLEDMK
jgi:VanZ family protein